MLGFISYDLIEGWVKAINQAFGINIPENITADLFFIIITFVFIFYILRPIFRNQKWRKEQLYDILKGYGYYTTLWERWLYIDTWLQEKAPNDYDEPFEAQFQDFRTNKDAIRFFIKNVLRKDNDFSPYYCILGGSGMGKSTFLVNLILRYYNNYRKSNLPYPIKLINCGNTYPLTKFIDEIDNKENTILVLDALDENNEAIDGYKVFLNKLLESIIHFRIVIITCRTQFFEKYEDELNVLSELIHDPVTKKNKCFQKYYVSPFNTDEISRYLLKKYLLMCKFRAFKKAKKIVEKCNKLMARPLLLSYIDDLLNTDIELYNYSIARIYEIIIDKWLEREANFVSTSPEENDSYKKKLLDFSSDIALCLAKKSSGQSFIQSEVQDIIKKNADEKFIKEGYLKGRSLLNRNSKNDYKFAHKSFMEYLVAYEMFIEKRSIELESIDCLSNDMIPKFLSSIIIDKMPTDRIFGKNGKTFISRIVTVSLGKTFSYSFDYDCWHDLLCFLSFKDEYIQNYVLNNQNSNFINIYVFCNVSQNINKYLSSIFYSIKKHNDDSFLSLGIMIDCSKNYSIIKNQIFDSFDGLKNPIRITFFISEYDFTDTSLFDFLRDLSYNRNIRITSIVFLINQNTKGKKVSNQIKFVKTYINDISDKYILDNSFINFIIHNRLYKVTMRDGDEKLYKLGYKGENNRFIFGII